MTEKPDIVKQYEQQKAAGETLYFDPVELEDIYHYYGDEGLVDKEEEVLKLAKELHPGDLVTCTLEAEFALNANDAEGCLRILEPVFSDENLMHCILKSGALAKLGDMTGALEYAGLAMQEDDPLVAYDLGLGFMNADQYTVALRYYKRCLDAYPNDLRSLLGILFCLNQVGSTDEIINCADKALEIDSFCMEAWMAKGAALTEQNKWAEAEECYDYALAIYPEDVECAMMKANCCIQQNRPEEAMQIALDTAERTDDEQRANLYMLAAHLAFESKRPEDAVEFVWRAVESNPRDEDLMERAAFSFAEFGASNAATVILWDRYKRERDKMPPHLLSLLGEQYTQQGHYEEALPVYEDLAKAQPSSGSYTLLAGTYISLNKFRKAYNWLVKANELELMWQAYVLMAVCAHEMDWETAATDAFIMAYQLSAKGAKRLLGALSPLLVESFEKKGIIAEAERWRQEKLVQQLLTAKARVKKQKLQEQQLRQKKEDNKTK